MKNTKSSLLVILVYVDDNILAGDSTTDIEELKQYLKSQFFLKDLGDLKYFLGLEIAKSSAGTCISPRKYTSELLADTGLTTARPDPTPMKQNLKLDNEDGDLLEDIADFQRLGGRLIYLTVTRPNISFAVQTLSQFMHAPRKPHLEAAFRVVKYLKGRPGQRVFMSAASELKLEAYCDSDWASCPVTRRSSAEAEYRSLADLTCEIIWLQRLNQELGVKVAAPASIHCDNKAAIHVTHNLIFYERTKHMELDCHIVRVKIQKGVIRTEFVPSKEKVADLLTKALSRQQHQHLVSRMGVLNLFKPHLEGMR
ncbi:hypothetical protein GH714_037152 [Hevea brasiliensis]|uniref:Reverse transcriptase Ty1/copia-type domain-containing protein n=1 Tax=Hevea brasiliensis TaxID=3981 RepID=A0A6A6L826_HEVBR|nr:hypothetical protein GH714_037152 [Hevea brasiliensis]